MKSGDLFDADKVSDVDTVYYTRSSSGCRVIYYEMEDKIRKKLREISFSPREIDSLKCVLTFRKIAETYNENIPYEPDKHYTNGVYTYYKRNYEGYVTVLDMNSAYLWALSQPLADWTTRTEVTRKQVYDKEFDYYCFENDIWCHMFYKDSQEEMAAAMLWADVKIYGYKSKLYYQKTTRELYRLKTTVNKEKYKNVANIAVGCMHKRSGKQNNTTLAASLYAFFEYYIHNLVAKFEKKGYNVIMITTDSIKVAGEYHPEDNLVTLGDGLGEFKIEFQGKGVYYSVGHYEESKVKWKGKPLYMIEGYPQCQFIDNLEKEREVYEKYAIK